MSPFSPFRPFSPMSPFVRGHRPQIPNQFGMHKLEESEYVFGDLQVAFRYFREAIEAVINKYSIV